MLEQKYDHRKVEEGVYQDWVDNGYFTAGDITKKPYSMVIPPPNVTGMLHTGHAWDFTLMDIITRYKRLQGYDVLSLPASYPCYLPPRTSVPVYKRNEYSYKSRFMLLRL